VLALAAIVVAGIAARVIALDRLPGVNGDEAWYGVNVQEMTGGTPVWRTPVGNLLNPFHSGPLFVASLIVPPSLGVLRYPAVLWGCLAVVLCYPLLAPVVGRRAALVAATLLTIHPTVVAQARIGWDPSGTPLASLVAIALALRNRPIATALAAAAALVVHPTNVFLLPILAGAWAPHAAAKYRLLSAAVQRRYVIAATVTLLIGVAIGFPVARAIAHAGLLPSIEMVLERLLSPRAWLETISGVLRLFSGVTVALSISGATGVRPLAPTADILTAAVFVVPLLFAWNHLGPLRERLLWLAAGMGAAVATFHVVAGPAMLQPSFERYALFLIVPLIVLCALLLDAAMARRPLAGSLTAGAACAGLAALLVGAYFVPLITRGGAAHETYRTGPVEPKAAAFAAIQNASRNARSVAVVAENWWLYWPMRYLAGGERARVQVQLFDNSIGVWLPAGAIAQRYPHIPEKVFAVAFDGGVLSSRLTNRAQLLFTAVDPLHRPIVRVFSIDPADSRQLLGLAPWESSPR
jgi:hypothetical protein